jgi:hypothetical protein
MKFINKNGETVIAINIRDNERQHDGQVEYEDDQGDYALSEIPGMVRPKNTL